jgi:SAM-dependent methyltransferase
MSRQDARAPRDLVRAAAAPYLGIAFWTWCFAKGKLGGDPAFATLSTEGLIPDGARLLDLGCGMGLLGAWLHAGRQRHEAGDWPASWPAPPRIAAYRGIECSRRDVTLAQRALHGPASIEVGDIRTAPFETSDVVVILDVLHYLGAADQEAVLARVRACLPPTGSLLLRVGDAAAGRSFRFSTWVDHVVLFFRGQRTQAFHCRSATAWQELLISLGFAVRVVSRYQGATYANVLFQCEPIQEAP